MIICAPNPIVCDMPQSQLEGAVEATGVSLADIRQARNRISSHIHRTPVMTCVLADKWLNDSQGLTRFHFKVESFQKTGSFKFRGACNALTALSENGDMRPVVTHSSGNHGQALASAAKLLDRTAWIVVPETASRAKVDALDSYGARIVRCKSTFKDRAHVAERVTSDVGGILIHSFLDKRVVCGQGTVGLELLEQVPSLDAVIVSIGGGGLISGVSIAIKSQCPSVRIIGAEPENGNAAARSIAAGKYCPIEGNVNTVADGLKANVGKLGWQVVRRLVDDVISVSEQDIVEATKFIWQRMKLVIEPSAGVAVAAARSDRFRQCGFKNVGVILCGGNVDVEKLPWNS